jgi:hypothetical protein
MDTPFTWVLIFVVILIPTMLFIRSITRSDIGNLRFMVVGLGVIGGRVYLVV